MNYGKKWIAAAAIATAGLAASAPASADGGAVVAGVALGMITGAAIASSHPVVYAPGPAYYSAAPVYYGAPAYYPAPVYVGYRHHRGYYRDGYRGYRHPGHDRDWR